jgi:ribosomal protein L11 methyltransferase
MTVKATVTVDLPDARRIFDRLERDCADIGPAISLWESGGGMWTVDAYFEDGSAEDVAAMLRERLAADGLGTKLSVEALPERDWLATSLDSVVPVAAGRFFLHGSHHRRRIPGGRLPIEIDAGQAFGTGHHATTAGCLIVLDRLMRTRRFVNPFDFGTGSGVLSIAMAKTLRRPVLASDIDPVAVRVARENVRLNGVSTLVTCIRAGGVAHPTIGRRAPFDLIVANILAEPLIRLAPRIAPLVARRGTLVLSGLLLHQRERVTAAYGGQGLPLREARAFDGWSVLVLGRGGS